MSSEQEITDAILTRSVTFCTWPSEEPWDCVCNFPFFPSGTRVLRIQCGERTWLLSTATAHPAHDQFSIMLLQFCEEPVLVIFMLRIDQLKSSVSLNCSDVQNLYNGSCIFRISICLWHVPCIFPMQLLSTVLLQIFISCCSFYKSTPPSSSSFMSE